MTEVDVVLVGAGLAGLACARELAAQGVRCLAVEAESEVGGRARTDQFQGFLLDRGFQVMLTAYPEARRVLDYPRLDLRPFEPGALVRYRGAFRRLVDPWRRPRHALTTLASPLATWGDKWRIARLRSSVCRGELRELYERPEATTLDVLRRAGFSDRFIDNFFRPFLGGVFLDPRLDTSSRMFEFVFRMFSSGDAALPAAGMGALARQLADGLPAGTVRTGCRVTQVDRQGVTLDDGSRLDARAVVLAVEAPAAARLLGDPPPAVGPGVTCLYFAADRPPLREPILVLNGEGRGPVNNLCVPSQVAPAYAPLGESLVSATVLGTEGGDDEALQAEVLRQLSGWFGPEVLQWRHLRTYRICGALPFQLPPALDPVQKPATHPSGVFRCGDYLETASIQGALASGRRAAAAVLAAQRPAG